MPRPAQQKIAATAAEMAAAIRRFLASCREPVLVEPGEEPLALETGRFAIEPRGENCVLHAWGDAGNLVRRVTAVAGETRGKLELRAKLFGGGELTLALVDAARNSGSLRRKAGPAQFRETLRRMLERDFPEWKIEQLTTAPDLEHSLSGLYARGLMRRGSQAWALLGVPAGVGAAACDQALTFGLIWLDRLWRRERQGVIAGLQVFLPQGQARATANRLAHLRANALRYQLHEFDAKQRITSWGDERDYGNLLTELLPCRAPIELSEPFSSWVPEFLTIPGFEAVPGTDGWLSLRVRGLPFARAGSGMMTYGLDTQQPLTPPGLPRALLLARELARFRSPDALDRLNPLYRKYPESWLESQIRQDLRLIDPTLRGEPVYTHPLSVAGADRGVIDLLACDDRGRLVVIELKATEDIHLPLQGLDYWMRVRWHLEHGDFQKNGFFPGIELASQPPRLLLVSPAVEFHPATETILRFFPAGLEVERVGVSEEWRKELRVVFRRRGAARLA